MTPFFSIIIPTYNRANRISKAIDSVLSQTYSDFELIIVDDGSTDNTKEVVSSYKDERIVYIYQENAERSAARNNGINHTKGEFICFLDSDDYYLDNHLRELHSTILKNNSKKALYYTGMLITSEGTGVTYGKQMLISSKLHPVKFIWMYFILINSVCVHRDIFSKHSFNEAFSVWEDTHLWLRIAAEYSFIQIPVYTTVQVIHNTGTVEENFANVKIETVNQYIYAVEDLFQNYNDIISPYISEKEKEAYIVSKIYMFKQFAYQNKQYNIVFKLNKMAYNRHQNKLLYYKQQFLSFSKKLLG